MKGQVKMKNLKTTAQIAAEWQVEEGVVRSVSSDLKPIWEDCNGMKYWTPVEASVIEERLWLYLIRTEDASRKKIRRCC